jgi:hypothetical protein
LLGKLRKTLKNTSTTVKKHGEWTNMLQHCKIHMEKQRKVIVTLLSVQMLYCTLNIYLFTSTHPYVFSKCSLSTSPLSATFSEYNSIFYTGCSITPCSKTIFLQIFLIISLFHNSNPIKWFLMIGKDSSLRTNRYCRRQWQRPSLSAV